MGSLVLRKYFMVSILVGKGPIHSFVGIRTVLSSLQLKFQNDKRDVLGDVHGVDDFNKNPQGLGRPHSLRTA